MRGPKAHAGLMLVALLYAACGGKAGEPDSHGTSAMTGSDTGTETVTFTGTATFTMTGTRMATGIQTFTGTGLGTSTAEDTGVGTYTPTITSTSVDTAKPVCATEVTANYDAGAKVLLGSGLDFESSGFTGELRVEQICQDNGSEPPTCPAPVAGAPQLLLLSDATGGAKQLQLAHPELPVDFFEAGETLTMVLEAWPYTDFFGTQTCQSLQLSRSGVAILFAHYCYGPSQSAHLPVPERGVPAQVTVGDLTLTDARVECTATGGFCDYWYHSADVLLLGTAARVGPGHSVAIGDYSFTLSRYRDAVDSGGNCDFRSEVQFIAIAKP